MKVWTRVAATVGVVAAFQHCQQVEKFPAPECGDVLSTETTRGCPQDAVACDILDEYACKVLCDRHYGCRSTVLSDFGCRLCTNSAEAVQDASKGVITYSEACLLSMKPPKVDGDLSAAEDEWITGRELSIFGSISGGDGSGSDDDQLTTSTPATPVFILPPPVSTGPPTTTQQPDAAGPPSFGAALPPGGLIPPAVLVAPSTTAATFPNTTNFTTPQGTGLPQALGSGPLAASVAAELDALYNALLSDTGTNRVSSTVPGASISIQRVTRAQVQADGNRTTVEVSGTGASVSVPLELFTRFGDDVIVTAVAFDDNPEFKDIKATDGSQVEAMGLVSISLSLFHQPQAALHVSGLQEPVRVTLGANATDRTQCAFYDEHRGGWSSEGLQQVGGGPGSPLICASNHLTLFAGIIRGMAAALLCSQATLLSAEGVSKIIKTDWHQGLPGQIYCGMILLTFIFVVLAVCLDWCRSMKGHGDDEVFLVQLSSLRHSQVSELSIQEASKAEKERSSSTCYRCCSDTCGLLESMCTEIVAGLDDSCEFFKELYDGCRKPELEGPRHCSLRRAIVSYFIHTHCHTVHCITSAALHMQVDDVKFFLAQEREQSKETSVDSPKKVISSHSTIDDMRRELLERVQQDFDHYSHIWYFPVLFCKVFSTRCTLLAVLRYSLFIPTRMSTMLFVCDVYASMALAALFYQASGSAQSEESDPMCDPGDIWEEIGQIITVGVVTVLVGMIPGVVISSLHQRDFVAHPDGDSPEWRRQLRLWHLQDRIIYIFGIAFILFCMFFNFVFVANVTRDDCLEWLLSCFVQMVQSMLIVPSIMTLLTLSATMVTICSTSVRHQARLLCLPSHITGERSSLHRPPASKWNSRAKRRASRQKARRLQSEKVQPVEAKSVRWATSEADRGGAGKPTPRCPLPPCPSPDPFPPCLTPQCDAWPGWFCSSGGYVSSEAATDIGDKGPTLSYSF